MISCCSDSGLKDWCRRLELVWLDSSYGGDELHDWVAILTGWIWQGVKRSDEKTNVVLLLRWGAEQNFAWLSFHRRLSKDYRNYRP